MPGSKLGYACFARSALAIGRIRGIDTSLARGMPGVDAVLTADDLPVAMPAINAFDLSPRELPASPMAMHDVLWPGHALALVIADSAEHARAAAEQIHADIEPAAGCGDDAQVAAWSLEHGVRDADAVAFVVEACVEQPRVAATALEPRGILAEVSEEGRLDVWVPTQSPARARDEIAASLDLAPEQVRVRAPDVGGAFGSKATPGPDELLVAAAAWKLRRPVAWIASRSEEFLAGVHGRGAAMRARLECAADGRLLNLSASLRFPAGGWLPYSALVPARNAARLLPGPYRVASGHVEAAVFSEPRAAVNIYRGAGRPEAALLMEQLVDEAARRIGEDPLSYRLRHLIGAGDLPWTLPGGESLDAADVHGALQLAARRFDYAAERASVQRRREAGERVGIGIACYLEPCGQGFERARLTLWPDRRATLCLGTASQGQGHARPFGSLVREILGEDVGSVELIEGDTDRCPDGIGALASRSMAIGGSAVREAALAVRRRLADGEALPLTETVRFDAPAEAFGHGAVIVRVALDVDTCAPQIERLLWVDDCGRAIDERGVRAQQLGGLAQGVGQALFEALRYDDQHQLLTGSLMDYACPRAADLPADITLVACSSPTVANPLGVKGIGEAGCIGVPAAVLNGVRDALARGRPLPVELPLSFPLTGDAVWRALQWLEH